MTDQVVAPPTAGWVCYDGACGLCLRWLRRVERPLLRAGFRFAPLQSDWVKARLNLTDHDALPEMRLLQAGKPALGGADAAVVLMRHVWWLWPLWWVSRIPGAMPIFRAVYRQIAANRRCANGTCNTKRQASWMDWLPLIALPIATLPFRAQLPNWLFMWLFVTAMFAGCKWLTWRRASWLEPRPNHARTLGYLFLWPGMDAKTFLIGRCATAPKLNDWFFATCRLFIGLALFWLAARGTITGNDNVNAWLGMFGLTLLLHFGSFHLAALIWQSANIPAKPLMQSPATATSLGDFWGARWNTAFNKLVHDLAFRPLARRIGIAWATLSVFAISGIIHELAISFPARGGYGLPFGYFLLQGCGVLIERSSFGKAIGLGHGWRGWLFMVCFTAAPAYWLFHPAFVHNVILPMLRTIGAT